MRLLLRLAHNGKFTPNDRKELSKTAWQAVRVYDADIGNLRISTRAVELDLLLKSETTLNECKATLETIIGPVLSIRRLDVKSPQIEKSEAIRIGIELFNEERYWESHEALESAWLVSVDTEKEVLQGLILLAAGMVHWQKNEKEVTLSILKRALAKIEAHGPRYLGVDLDFTKQKINEILSSGEPEFLKIKSD